MQKRRRFFNDFLTYIGFAGPATFVFVAVIIIPFLSGIYLSFTNWDGISDDISFIGLANYMEMFTDQGFWFSLLLTLKYVVCTVILTNLIAFMLAYLLTGGSKVQIFFRTVYFTPYLIGGIILGVLWRHLIFLRVLPFLGEKFKIPVLMTTWLGDPQRAFWALVIGFVWQYAGYMMMIYIAGFMSIPYELLEAAGIDGANSFDKLKHITLPFMVTPMILSVFISVQRSFMIYDVNLALTGGEPFKSTVLVSMYVYEKAFTFQQYGVGQAEALFLFMVIAAITVTQYYFSKKLEVET